MKWTSDNDQRLLLLILEQVQKLDCAKLAAAWKAKYRMDFSRSVGLGKLLTQ